MKKRERESKLVLLLVVMGFVLCLIPTLLGSQTVASTNLSTDVDPGNREVLTHTSKEANVWREKFSTMPKEVDSDHSVCFVHVGKTAGSTMACYLGFRYECGDNFFIPPGRLPKVTTHLMHTIVNDCQDHKFQYYLFSLRNPLTRIISWFQYEKIKEDQKDKYYNAKAPLFVECYSTLNKLAEEGLDKTGSKKSVCQERAISAIKGKQGYIAHNFYNFGFYLDQIVPNSRIVAMRTEHLTEDWDSVEAIFGGTYKFTMPVQRKNVSRRREDPLSPLAIANLCGVLCEEFQVYKAILRRAENLTPEQVTLSMAEVQESCPLETFEIRRCK